MINLTSYSINDDLNNNNNEGQLFEHFLRRNTLS